MRGGARGRGGGGARGRGRGGAKTLGRHPDSLLGQEERDLPSAFHAVQSDRPTPIFPPVALRRFSFEAETAAGWQQRLDDRLWHSSAVRAAPVNLDDAAAVCEA